MPRSISALLLRPLGATAGYSRIISASLARAPVVDDRLVTAGDVSIPAGSDVLGDPASRDLRRPSGRPSHPQQGGESQSLTGYNSWINSLTFSPDGTTLISGSEDDTVRLWSLNVNDAIERICSTTSNVLTPQQWHAYIPELPYKPPCRS